MVHRIHFARLPDIKLSHVDHTHDLHGLSYLRMNRYPTDSSKRGTGLLRPRELEGTENYSHDLTSSLIPNVFFISKMKKLRNDSFSPTDP